MCAPCRIASYLLLVVMIAASPDPAGMPTTTLANCQSPGRCCSSKSFQAPAFQLQVGNLSRAASVSRRVRAGRQLREPTRPPASPARRMPGFAFLLERPNVWPNPTDDRLPDKRRRSTVDVAGSPFFVRTFDHLRLQRSRVIICKQGD